MALFLSYRCINRTVNLLKEAIVIFRERFKTRKCVNANNIEIISVSVCALTQEREMSQIYLR